YFFGHPSTISTPGHKGMPGGFLAQARQHAGLSQTQLGQIDPTSETIKLATFGLRGVAALVLWEKANDYKMKEDWPSFAATLNQIIIVEPHFISVWIHQAWNLSYNTSVEFDDYHERYRWVIKGINFLKEGIVYNKYEPRLLWEIGWTIAQKIGRADEHKEFRRLFKADDEFNESRPLALRDNWLVGKDWFQETIKLANSIGKGVGGKPPLIYLSNPTMCQMYYAIALEEDGSFGEVARRAWKTAEHEWHNYGSLSIPYSDGENIYLNDQETKEKQAEKVVAELDALQPGLREAIRRKKREQLNEKQLEAYQTPRSKRTREQVALAAQAEARLKVTHEDVARQVQPEQRARAKKLAKDAVSIEKTIAEIKSYRDIVNFLYWRLRAQVEQTNEALNARKSIYQGNQAYLVGDLITARDAYEKGLALWRKVLDSFPKLAQDQATGADMIDTIRQYRKIYQQLDEPFPKNFILQDMVDKYDPDKVDKKP
ncbi:MAG: hypothetical protein ACWGMZ_13045, partial [Thermoguttaceae bacterium]